MLCTLRDQTTDIGLSLKLQLGATPLHYAAMEGHAGTCQKLVKFGADLDARNEAGSTPLALAVSIS